MPSFKKRVHSQRIPQHERTAVTPYEGAYDEKYSSDEENIEYEVCEPDDMTERSNSTVTFSEDIYDSDAIEDMIKNQIRKASEISQEGFDVPDGSKPSKSILKDGRGKGSKKDGPAPTLADIQLSPSQHKITEKIVSPREKIAEGGAKVPETTGVNKSEVKGEKLTEAVTKPLQGITTVAETSNKGERETVTKSLQSTIPLQIDQITDSSATNKYDFDKNGQKLIQTPQDKGVIIKSNEETVWETVDKPFATERGQPTPDLEIKKAEQATVQFDVIQQEVAKKPIEQISEKLIPEDTKKPETSPTREEAADTAMQLIEDITKTVQDVFPESKHTTEKQDSSIKIINFEGRPIQNGGTKQLESVTADNIQISKLQMTKDQKSPTKIEPKEKQKLSEPTTKIETVEKISEAIKTPIKTTEKVEAIEKISKEILTPTREQKSTVEEPLITQETFAKENQSSTTAVRTAPADILKEIKITEKVSSVDVSKPKTTNKIATEEIQKLIKDTSPTEKVANGAAKTLAAEKPTAAVLPTDAKPVDILMVEVSDKKPASEVEETQSGGPSDVLTDLPAAKDSLKSPDESKPRVIFRIDSEDDLHDLVSPTDPTSPTGEFSETSKLQLKEILEQDQIKIEERLKSMKGRIFDISDESLLKTKELVDQRLRKISEIKPPQEIEEPPSKKEKSPVKTEMVKIGRFHITPALVEEVISRSKEREIAERLKTTRTDDGETHDELEKELPEKLTEADLEEVIRELKKEGLNTDVYLQPEDPEKEEKREKTLKRVERRFERMASETLEKEKEEEGVSEEKLNEKREIQFQQMLSNLSTEEVAEYQQEYLQLWEDGGLSSFTPTEDWESRDPDTPENELDDDSPRKSESFRGSHGTGETGEATKSSEPKKSTKSPTSPPKPLRISSDISPKTQPLTPVDHSHVGSSPSEIDQSSGFVSERSDDIPTFGDRKKFWEQMSSSQSSETASELPRSMIESVSSVDSVEIDKIPKSIEETEKISVKTVKTKVEKDTTDESGFVKSLTESYSKKIAAGEIVMPAIPRPKSSASKESLQSETEILRKPDSADTAVVSELELKLKSRDSSAPITETTVVPGSTKLEQRETSTDSETEFISKYGVESVAFDNTIFTDDKVTLPVSERKKVFDETSLTRKSDRSMSLPTTELPIGVKGKKKHFEDQMKKEMIVEQIMTQEQPEKKRTPDIEEAAESAMTELLIKGVKIAEKKLQKKDTHEEKSEIESNEKETKKRKKKTDEFIPSITVTETGQKQPESVGESEDTQSESDITPEEARVVDPHWEGTQSGGFSPKDDIDYPKEVRESGIGRWIGQEDLSKQIWEKDDLDGSQFKMQTKWERTRSEGASPKEHYVCTPEEHYPDTVWEVPVQEQLEKEEITHDIPIEKQVIIEKDEEEYDEEEEGKVKLTEEEAKGIAEEILEYIQFEVENRSSFLINDDETPEGLTQTQVTDYLRHLTGGKEFDVQDVQLIESILSKRQKGQFWKSQSADTAACSVDITDEELRSTGIDNDISPVESQMTKLKNLKEGDFFKLSTEISENLPIDDAQTLKDVEIVDQTLAEVKESLEAAQEQLIEQHKMKSKSEFLKKESPSEFEFKGISYDRTITEPITEQPSDWERTKTTTKKTEHEESQFEQTHSTKDTKREQTTAKSLQEEIKREKAHQEEFTRDVKDHEKIEKKLSKDSSDEEKKLLETQRTQTKAQKPGAFETDSKFLEKTIFDKTTKSTEEILETVVTDGRTKEHFDSQTDDREVQKRKEVMEQDAVVQKKEEKIQTTSKEQKEETRDSWRETGKTETKIVEKDDLGISKKTEILITDSKTMVTETKTGNEFKNLEISVPESVAIRKIGDQVYSSEESPRSTSMEDSMKSPGGDEILSSSSERQGDKPDVVFRHSTSLHLNRRSGTDLEPYSSSGESNYHSFEQTSSRPCSSDVEGLLTGNIGTTGSSEYESAMSHETSSKIPTLTDYQTAVSSLSSRESIKSLDSESSGHLASVEVSSEASETLIPSALELDVEAPGMDDDDLGVERGKAAGQPPAYRTQMSAPAAVGRSLNEDFEIISESEVASWTGVVSEDEEGVIVTGEEPEEHAQKMKRSHEMTFQPEPKPIVFSESLDGLIRNGSTERLPAGSATDENSSIISERFASSLEESGSVLSMSLSTTSETMRTVVELSHTDSDKMDGSLTVSATSLEVEDFHPQATNEMSTSTASSGLRRKTESVTISTSSSESHGVPCVSTQVTSVSRKSSMVDDPKSESEPVDLSHANGPTQVEYVADYDEVETTKTTKKPQGHRRKESTSNFVPTMMWNLSEARTQKLKSDITETEEEYGSNKYVYDITLTEKEVKNDEKKEADDSEGYDLHERKTSEGEEPEEFKDYDNNRPQSQTSRTDSDSGRRPVSSVFSEDQPDSELSELMKQGSSETEREDPLERPLSPEPEDMENKDITPEFSSEAQASVTELEMEYSGAFSRRDEYASHVSPIREEKSDARFKETDEYPEVEAVSDGLRSQTSLESTVAEKHELETGEKEILQKKSEDIPDITVTEHMTPVSHQKFQYPESKDSKASKTPDTPASSMTSSSSTDQGKEYNLDDEEIKKIPKTLPEEKGVSEAKDEKESLDSPSSDSFEMLDKPDITDEFVIIEEVGKEAQENDEEGKSIKITSGKKKPPKRVKDEQEVKMSPPTTKMTDLKYYPSEEDPELFSFDSDSPPQPTTRKFVEKLKRRSSKEEKDDVEYEQQIEQNKKWLETQFQGEQAAKVIGGFGYEMEFERAPLEDIKEEDLNELDSSSKIGSMGSQKESLGSFGSVKDSFSSTPDYDVLAGRKYFTRSGDHDDVSMSSLQEFELIEKKLMENGKKSGSSSSQDSLSSKKLGTSSKSGQDDVSTGSLKEFETLENACATVVNMEKKAKQEEAILTEIDEGHESQISESESCETVSAVMREKFELETEDFDKRMFEIDEIIRQAQSNVEKFSEMQALEKIETIGRGDSYEEVAKVPDLELDLPLPGKSSQGRSHTPSYSTKVVTKKKVEEWRAAEKTEQQKSPKPKQETPKQSELLQNGGKIKSISADCLEIQTAEKQIILEGKEDTISLDSYRSKPQKQNGFGFEMTHKSDSMEEVSRHHEISSGEYTSSGTEHTNRPPPRSDYMLGSTDSLDPSSSTATHATYQYETDSVMSSSFTSGDSNTMVSSTDNLDLLVSGHSVIDLSKDLGLSRTDDWLENLEVGGANPLDRKLDQRRSEIHKRDPKVGKQIGKNYQEITELGPQVQKITFRGPNPEEALQEYAASLKPEDDVMEVEEVDEHGNVHIKKVLRQRVIIRPNKELTKEELEEYINRLGETDSLAGEKYSHIIQKSVDVPTEIQKITFKGPDAEKQLQEYMQQQQPEIEEVEEVDEHGNVHIKKILRQRVVVRSGNSLPQKDLQKQHIEEDFAAGVQKITFKGPDAEKQFQEFMQQQEPEVEEIEEVDEHGNVHIKRVLRQRVVIRPDSKFSEEELQKYLTEQQQFGGETTSQIQKVTFKGPDAEKQFQEFLQQQEPEVEEIEEVDEHGNVHIKRVLRQRVVIRPDSKLTQEQFEYLTKHSEEGAIKTTPGAVTMPSGIQKITFKGPDAEKQLQEYMQQQKPEIEEIEEVDEHGNVHIKRVLRQRIVVRPDSKLTEDELHKYLAQQQDFEDGGTAQIQKVTFKGPDAEKQFQEFMQQQEPEIEEIEEVDEDGNVHVKRVLRQRVVVRSEGGTAKDLKQYLTQLQEPQLIESGATKSDVQKITFKGPDAEKQLQEFLQQQQQPEIEEIEEVDEHGNVHIKRVLRQRVVVRPDSKLTDEELQKYLTQQQQFGGDTTSQIQKVTFKGPDAEKQFQEFLQQQEPEVEEIEEVDEHGNVHIKRVLRQRVVIRPDSKLKDEELQKYLTQQQQFGGETTSQIQKVTFKGPDAEKQFQEFLQQQEPDIEEIEEVDEHGNVHIKRVLRQRVVIRPDSKLSEEELRKYLTQQQQFGGETTSQIQKVTFKGPDAEKQFQEFMQQQEPEIEEIEEVDEQGNVHIKRVLRQRVVVRSDQPGFSLQGKDESSRSLTEGKRQESGGKVYVQKIVLEPEALTDRLLTEEEFQERLKQHQTTFHAENVYIGSGEPFVSEIIEPLDEEGFSHIIHRKMQMAPEVQKLVFRGPNADEAMKAYVEALNPGEDFEEVEEVDADGNVHVKRILRRKIVLKPEDLERTGLTGEELRSYLQQFEFEHFDGGEGPRVQPPHPTNIPTKQILTEGFSSSVVLTEKDGHSEGEKVELETSSATRKERGISQRPPLVSDVSMDDEAEYDTTEHDWRHQLEILHAEADEEEIDQSLDAALAGSYSSQKK